MFPLKLKNTNLRSDFNYLNTNLWSDFERMFDFCNSNLESKFDVPSKSDFLVELPLPGLNKEHLSVEVSEKTLIIKTKVKNADGFLKRYTDSSYSYLLSDYHDLNKIEAKMENGLLKIKVPLKEKEQTQNKTIEIK